MGAIMDYEKENVVSVWVGTIGSQEELDSFLQEDEEGLSPFANSLNANWIDHDFCESLFTEERVPAHELLATPFSYAPSFRDPLFKAAKAGEVNDVNAAVLLYDFSYPAPA